MSNNVQKTQKLLDTFAWLNSDSIKVSRSLTMHEAKLQEKSKNLKLRFLVKLRNLINPRFNHTNLLRDFYY